MLRTTLTAIVLALSTCTAPATASDACEYLEEMAYHVMDARQAGLSARDVYDAVVTDEYESVFATMVSRAYDVPMQASVRDKQRVTNTYADQWYLFCKRT